MRSRAASSGPRSRPLRAGRRWRRTAERLVGREQLDRPGRVAQHEHRFDAPLLERVGVAERSERLGDVGDGGVDAGDHSAGGRDEEPRRPVLAGPGPLRALLGGPRGFASRCHLGVGGDDLAVQAGLEPPPRQRAVHGIGHRRVDVRRRLDGEVAGLAGDHAHPAHPRLARHDAPPDRRQAVPHVQRIGDQVARGPGPQLHARSELSTRELRHSRRALTTESDTPLPPRSSRVGLGRQLVSAHLVGEQRGQLEQLGFRRHPSSVQVLDPVERRLDTLVLQLPPRRHFRAHANTVEATTDNNRCSEVPLSQVWTTIEKTFPLPIHQLF